MTELDKPEFMWGIGHYGLSITNRLFDRDLHVFKRDAVSKIEEYQRIWKEEGARGMEIMPILVKVVTTLGSEAEAANYDAEQTAWLEKRTKAKTLRVDAR